jgi:hypothetical protein
MIVARRFPGTVLRRGAVTFWLVLSLTVIVGVVALGMDGGRMMDERRRAQAAADAAALAGAADLYSNYWTYQGADPTGSAQRAALNSAATNGYANDGSASVVTINVPPQSGTFRGQAGYVEVVIQSNLAAGFSGVFGSSQLPLRARAVARGQPKRIGVLSLQALGVAVIVDANATLSIPKASLVINSADSAALQQNGNGTVTALTVDIAGGYGGLRPLTTGLVRTGVPPTADPLAPLPAIDLGQYTVQSTSAVAITGDDQQALQPGVYRGGISVSGNGKLTLTAGLYIMSGGGFQVSGNAQVVGDNVLIYNTTGSTSGGGILSLTLGDSASAGPISIGGNANVSVTPPTSGPYAGIGFFQDRSVTTAVQISGNGSLQIPGAIYAPAAAVQLSGNAAGNVPGGAYIVSSLQISGNGDVTVDPGNNYLKVPDVRLTE